MGANEGFYLSAGEGEAYDIAGGVTTFKVRGEDTGGHFEITESTLPPGYPGTPAHVHDRVDHAFYGIEGVVDFQVGERIVHVGPGSCVFVPKGMAHRFSNPSKGVVRWLQVDSIGGRELMFKELGEAMPEGAPPDRARMLEIMKRHDARPA
jgi:mannose-6-phosphate isomerase-like protein (cupin superfamily)